MFEYNYVIKSKSHWNELTFCIIKCCSIYLNTLITIAGVCNDFPDIIRHHFVLDYLIESRIVWNKHMLMLKIILMEFLVVLRMLEIGYVLLLTLKMLFGMNYLKILKRQSNPFLSSQNSSVFRIMIRKISSNYISSVSLIRIVFQ